MENSKGSSNIKNFPHSGKQSLLPPKCPFPSISPSYADFSSKNAIASKGIPRAREGHRHHHRTSSESFLVEEQPSWLEELLNEPETPVRRGGHRRSSSDSFAYMDVADTSNLDNVAYEGGTSTNLNFVPSWGFQDFDQPKNFRHTSIYTEPNSFGREQDRAWESSFSSVTHPSGRLSARENFLFQSSGPSSASQQPNEVPSIETRKQELEESGQHDLKGYESRECSYAKQSASEADPKRAKQQFAQRSRVRKLQYIAELERNVQALQAEGSEVSAELTFLDQQNIILTMENKALKQRLDSLTQEKFIKYLEQEMLEREIARMKALYQQQQQQQKQQQPSSTHRRGKSRDLDSQLANLSLKHKEPNSGHDSYSGSVRI